MRSGVFSVLGASLTVLLVQAAMAQQTALTVSVVSSAGNPMPYSTVIVFGAGSERFTNEHGETRFTDLSPGSYRVRSRQLGYVVSDTTVTLAHGVAEQRVRIVLQPVVFELSAVTVRASRACMPARAIGSGTSDLAILMAEIRKNAEREALLLSSHPLEFSMERRFGSRGNATTRLMRNDTVQYVSAGRPAYKPGSVVQPRPTLTAPDAVVMQFPTLADFADSVFLDTHCFRYAGTSRLGRRDAVRIDFVPLETVMTADVAGSLYLDPKSYVIRRAEFRLTRPESLDRTEALDHARKAVQNVGALRAVTEYREILPLVAIPAEITSTQQLVVQGKPVGEATERQRMLAHRWLRGKPGTGQSR